MCRYYRKHYDNLIGDFNMPIGTANHFKTKSKISIPQPPNSNQAWNVNLSFNSNFTDSSSSPKTFYAEGGASAPYVTNSVSKYGGGSLYLPGGSTTARLKGNNSIDFKLEAGDYTVECWIYMTSWSAGRGGSWYSCIFDTRTGSWPSPGLQLAFESSKKLVGYTGGGSFITGSTILSLNTWYHVAIVRGGSQTRIYLNGVQDAAVANSSNFSTEGMTIGNTFDAADGLDFRGYIDEFRLLKGTCLYSSNFIP